MPNEARTTIKVIGALLAGAAANFAMTMFAAPDHIGTALSVGLLLTSFGMMFAAFSVQAVMLPLALVSSLVRVIKREKLSRAGTKADKIQLFGRLLFIAIYGFVSSITGAYVGALQGGTGWFVSSVCFFIIGILLALLLPEELIWAVDDPGTASTEIHPNRNSPLKDAVANNEPIAVFTDKVAKSIVNVVTGTSSEDK